MSYEHKHNVVNREARNKLWPYDPNAEPPSWSNAALQPRELDAFVVSLPSNAPSEPEFTNAIDSTIRKAHYGAGKQPWDLIKEAGWAPHFAAANVLKYLRRDKQLEHSLESARWYFRELCKLGVVNSNPQCAEAAITLAMLMHLLTHAELALLRAP